MDGGLSFVVVREASAAEIIERPEFPALMAEYAAESAVDGLPPPNIKVENYARLDVSGLLHAFMGMKDEAMIGFIVILGSPLPHYAANRIAVCESFFVGGAHRKGGAGLRLLMAAEHRANVLGCAGLFVCTPIAGRLFEILPRRGYVETNR